MVKKLLSLSIIFGSLFLLVSKVHAYVYLDDGAVYNELQTRCTNYPGKLVGFIQPSKTNAKNSKGNLYTDSSGSASISAETSAITCLGNGVPEFYVKGAEIGPLISGPITSTSNGICKATNAKLEISGNFVFAFVPSFPRISNDPEKMPQATVAARVSSVPAGECAFFSVQFTILKGFPYRYSDNKQGSWIDGTIGTVSFIVDGPEKDDKCDPKTDQWNCCDKKEGADFIGTNAKCPKEPGDDPSDPICPPSAALDSSGKCTCPTGQVRGADGKCGDPKSPVSKADPCDGIVEFLLNYTKPTDSWKDTPPSGPGTRTRYTFKEVKIDAHDDDGTNVPGTATQEKVTLNTSGLKDADEHKVTGEAKVIFTKETSEAVSSGGGTAGGAWCMSPDGTTIAPSSEPPGSPPCNGGWTPTSPPSTPASWSWGASVTTDEIVATQPLNVTPTPFQCYKRTYTLTAEAGNVQILDDIEDPNKVTFTYKINFQVNGQDHKRADQRLAVNDAVVDVAIYKNGNKNNKVASYTWNKSNAFGGDSSSPYTFTRDGTNGGVLTANVSVPASGKPGDYFCGIVTVKRFTNTPIEVSVKGAPSGGGDQEFITSDCPKIWNKPYMKAFGGDVVAGSCLTTDASIRTQARKQGLFTHPGPGYRGSSTSLAAFASGSIDGFFTLPPFTFTFANTNASLEWGGEFGNNFACMKDLYGANRDMITENLANGGALSGPTINVNSLQEGKYYTHNGDVTLTGTFADPNNIHKTRLFVDGNVTISGSTVGGFAQSVDAHNRFVVAASQDIYIDPSVTNISGMLFAKGSIDTCYGVSDADLFNGCDTRLIINGSLMANTVKLRRTAGSLRDALPNETVGNTQAAEVFIHNPAPSVGVPSIDAIDSITTLAPIL